jgi:class 3 adenylate cyclase
LEVGDDAGYCPECAEAANRCPRCGAHNPSDFSYCSECGSRLDSASAAQEGGGQIAHAEKARRRTASPLLSHPDTPVGERRQLTLMFCDLVGSTELSIRLDPEELRAHVRTYQTHCVSVIRRFGGHVAQFLGDGIMACFGYPQSRGGDADRAVRAGLGIIAELPALNAELAQPILIRIGIHTGAVVMGERELFGAAPSIAARIQAAAAPNQVAISEHTRCALEGGFECEAIESRTSTAASPRIYRVRRALQ